MRMQDYFFETIDEKSEKYKIYSSPMKTEKMIVFYNFLAPRLVERVKHFESSNLKSRSINFIALHCMAKGVDRNPNNS